MANNNLVTTTKIDQMSVQIGSNAAAIQQTTEAYADTSGKLTTMWSVKMQVTGDGQYIAAGIGLGIENTGAGLQSQFLIAADRFALVNTIAGGEIQCRLRCKTDRCLSGRRSSRTAPSPTARLVDRSRRLTTSQVRRDGSCLKLARGS